MNNLKISAIIPVFNEEKIVFKVISELKEILKKCNDSHEIIVIDDNSTDQSGKILQTIEGINLIQHPKNRGYGASLKTGIKNAQGEWILIVDADGTYPLDSILDLYKYLNKYDMIVGARTGKNVNIPFFRRPAKKFISLLANFLSGQKIPDLNSGLRFFKKELALNYFHLFPERFSFTTTITLALISDEYLVKFIPIDYFKREGKSSISPLKDFFYFISLVVRIVSYFRPLKVFASLSLALFFSAILFFIYCFYFLHIIADTTLVIVSMASLQIFLSGLVAELIVKSRK